MLSRKPAKIIKPLSLLFLLALTLRITWIFLHGVSIDFGDTPDYLEAAKQICTTESYPFKSSLPFFRAPGVSYLLALSTACNLESLRSFLFFQAFLDSMTVLFIFRIAVLIGGTFRQACLAAVLAAVNPFFIIQVGAIQTEAAALFSFVGAVWSLLEAHSSRKKQFLFSCGIFLAFSALFRPAVLYFFPLFLFWYLAHSRKKMQSTFLFVVGFLIPLLPWSLYVYQRTDQVHIVNDAGCYNLWRGNTKLMRELYYAPEREIKSLELLFQQRENELVNENLRNDSSFWCRQAWKEFVQEPRDIITFSLYKAGIFFRPWLDPRYYSWQVCVISGVWMVLLYLGFLKGWRRIESREIRQLFLLILVAALFLHLPFQVVTRFRVPYVDFILIGVSGLAFGRGGVNTNLLQIRVSTSELRQNHFKQKLQRLQVPSRFRQIFPPRIQSMS